MTTQFHTLEINYIENTKKSLLGKKKNIYVAPVQLGKGIIDKKYQVGYWHHLNEEQDIYLINGSITELFEEGLVRELERKGYTVHEAKGWNLEPDQLTVFDENIISMRVEKFVAASYSSSLKVQSEFILKITGYLGVPSELRTYSVMVNIQSTPTNFTTSKSVIEKELNLLYNQGIRRIVAKLLARIQDDGK